MILEQRDLALACPGPCPRASTANRVELVDGPGRRHGTLVAVEGVVPLRGADTRSAARVLARAFEDDPFMVHLFPQTPWRRRVLPQFMGGIQRYCRRYGEVTTTHDLAAVACWLPPGHTDVTPWRIIRSGVGAVMPLLGPGGLRRFSRVVPAMERGHAEHMPGPHWFLWLLGTEPSRRNQGIASAVLRPVLERADEAGLPAYLDTHLEANLAFYRRLGFEPVVDETVDGLRFWGMRREPRS
jgi:hypothetical protein